MNSKETRVKVLLSIQRALLGHIYPSIRAIAVGFEDRKKLIVFCYLDKEPDEEDYENLNGITGEVCADIEFTEVEERCIFTLESFSKLDNLDSWVYIRKENK